MISPVVPPQSPLQELVHGPLETNHLVRPAEADLVYGMCTVGEAGRVVDKIVFAALDWRPGMRLALTCVDAGVMLACPAADGPIPMTAAGYFRIPYRTRRRAGLFLGDRALLIGHRAHHRLLIHPPAALDALCAASLGLFTQVRR